ncbi:MAG: magnesium/cobalt transporter CorA [Candidatus Margulisbacteria bacterium]|nr:magnesium/cobalt transporter CorA [Candidatus Margulisiibacteriota bacterium]
MFNKTKQKKLVENPVKSECALHAATLNTAGKPGDYVKITLFSYSEDKFEEKELKEVREYLDYKEKKSISWINIDGVHDHKIIKDVEEMLGLHPLVIEDLTNTSQRPKYEDFGDYIFILLKMLEDNKERNEIDIEQVSLIITKDLVVSFQEDKEGDVFECIRDRIRNNRGKIRALKADYLAYSLIDAIVDYCFSILEKIGETIEEMETDIIKDPDIKTIESIHKLKREITYLRRSIWPLRDVINEFLREESSIVSESSKVFIRDVYNHTVQLIDIIETCRDMVTVLLDIYVTSINNKLNEIMKVLAVIATIFMPLSFIASLYGMNFKYMPELGWHFGYPMALTIMAVIFISMLVYFKTKKWF